MDSKGELKRDDVLWLLGSLCGLFRIPFDAVRSPRTTHRPTPSPPRPRHQGRDADVAQTYRAQFRPHVDAEAAVDIRQALQLGMPVGRDRYAESVCAKAGIRFNSGKRGRTEGKPQNEAAPPVGQTDFGI